jgi:hypothetical protein
MLSRLERDCTRHSALRQHREQLSELWPYLSSLKSSKSCFCCLMMMPEKVFNCGHSICDVCIRRFGEAPRTEKHAFMFSQCILCGMDEPPSTYRLIPPSAGIRILSIDGGGIRGVIPLTFLQHLDKELGTLGCPLREFFDYVCGTSAGMCPDLGFGV